MKTILLTAAIAISSGLFAQTKLIAHRSHSGSLATFSVDANCNLGLGPMERYYELEKIEEKDSIQKDSVAIKKTEIPPSVPSQIKKEEKEKNTTGKIQSEQSMNENAVEKKLCPLPPNQRVSSEKEEVDIRPKSTEKPNAKKEKIKSSKKDRKASINPLAIIFLLSIIAGPALIYIFKAQRNRQ